MQQSGTRARLSRFVAEVWRHYAAHRRDLPWRDDQTPYRVAVSEMMLQQTQVARVQKKFEPFIRRFPDWQSLASASVKDVLEEWSGLGYNRRALYLKRMAEGVATSTDKETWKPTFEELTRFPGIGPNTAGAILAFAFNEPTSFIETNIRSAFIHFFFRKRHKPVADSEILPLIERALADRRNRGRARDWYYALMDYGADLKRSFANPSRRSAHYARQSPFKGSNRELRSKIIRLILKRPVAFTALASRLTGYRQADLKKNLADLEREGFIALRNGLYQIAGNSRTIQSTA